MGTGGRESAPDALQIEERGGGVMEVTEQVLQRARDIGADDGAVALYIARSVGSTEDPEPDLSGQWADGMTGPLLLSIVTEGLDLGDLDLFSDACQAYEDAFREAVKNRVQPVLR